MKKISESQIAAPHDPIRVLKIGRCASLSEKSELGYEVGIDTKSGILFRVVSNSGNGRFNSIWVPLTDIEKQLRQKGNEPITSRVLHPLFQGKSSNSPAFVFAVLKAEGLVVAGEEKDSGYLLGEVEGFKKAVSDFAAASTELSAPIDTYAPASKARPRKPKEA